MSDDQINPAGKGGLAKMILIPSSRAIQANEVKKIRIKEIQAKETRGRAIRPRQSLSSTKKP